MINSLRTSVVCSMLVLPFFAAAENENKLNKEALSQCQSEINGTKRLACYDELFKPTGNNDNTQPSDDVGKWSVSTEKSPVDDSENVFLILSGNDSFRDAFGQSVTPSIYITCREKKTELFISWDAYLGLNETTMLHRIDKQKAVTRTWSISSDTKAVFYRGNTIDFVKNLAKSDSMFARITPYNENPVTTTFDLKGLSNALKPIQKACSWK